MTMTQVPDGAREEEAKMDGQYIENQYPNAGKNGHTSSEVFQTASTQMIFLFEIKTVAHIARQLFATSRLATNHALANLLDAKLTTCVLRSEVDLVRSLAEPVRMTLIWTSPMVNYHHHSQNENTTPRSNCVPRCLGCSAC